MKPLKTATFNTNELIAANWQKLEKYEELETIFHCNVFSMKWESIFVYSIKGSRKRRVF